MAVVIPRRYAGDIHGTGTKGILHQAGQLRRDTEGDQRRRRGRGEEDLLRQRGGTGTAGCNGSAGRLPRAFHEDAHGGTSRKGPFRRCFDGLSRQVLMGDVFRIRVQEQHERDIHSEPYIHHEECRLQPREDGQELRDAHRTERRGIFVCGRQSAGAV